MNKHVECLRHRAIKTWKINRDRPAPDGGDVCDPRALRSFRGAHPIRTPRQPSSALSRRHSPPRRRSRSLLPSFSHTHFCTLSLSHIHTLSLSHPFVLFLTHSLSLAPTGTLSHTLSRVPTLSHSPSHTHSLPQARTSSCHAPHWSNRMPRSSLR